MHGVLKWRDLRRCLGEAETRRTKWVMMVMSSQVITMYPLVNSHIGIENGHRNRGFTHEKW
jgi:hypothetical protein